MRLLVFLLFVSKELNHWSVLSCYPVFLNGFDLVTFHEYFTSDIITQVYE